MYLSNPKLINNGVTIGGGYYTQTHIKSGGWRLDFVNTPGVDEAWCDMIYMFDADNGDGTRYAVYKWLNTGNKVYYQFVVHGHSFVKSKIKRGQKYFTPYPNKYTHIHIKVGSWIAANKKYLEFLKHLDPRIKVKTNYPSNIYSGKNKGEHIPGTLSLTPREMKKIATIKRFYEKIYKRPDVLKNKTFKERPDKHWNEYAWSEVTKSYETQKSKLRDANKTITKQNKLISRLKRELNALQPKEGEIDKQEQSILDSLKSLFKKS